MKPAKLMRKNRCLFLAYDHGLEHGPSDFDSRNFNPEYVLDIAKKGKFNAVILQKGVAEKYYSGGVPLIVKLNGKTKLISGEPISPQTCSVKYAAGLGASAVGYTIYPGSAFEREIFSEFARVQEEARDYGLPVVVWAYPRGSAIKNDTDPELLAYAARIGLELGADIVKLKYSGNAENFRRVIECAGRTKAVVAGGFKLGEDELLKQAKEIMGTGAAGFAIGRNIWRHPEPLRIAKELNKIVFG